MLCLRLAKTNRIKVMKLSRAKRVVLFLSLAWFFCIFSRTKAAGQQTIGEDIGCEEHLAISDFLLNEAEIRSDPIILVARLGDGETSRRYNQQRLAAIKDTIGFRNRYPSEKFVLTQGERVKGKGQVEVYISGRLSTIFKAGRRKNLRGRC